MNIDAEIVLEKAENVIAVPIDAVARGNKVKVNNREYFDRRRKSGQ